MADRLAQLEPPRAGGPPLREVVSALRRRRPPLAVVVACLLVGVNVLVFLGIAVAFAQVVLASNTFIVWKVLGVIVGPGVPFFLAAFGYRGIKRALVGGPRGEAMFLARVVAMVCLVIVIPLAVLLGLGDVTVEPSLAVPLGFLAFTWLPELFFRLPSARAYEQASRLALVPVAQSIQEAHFFLDLRACGCARGSATADTWPRTHRTELPVEAGDAVGFQITVVCPQCGRQRDFLFRFPPDATAADPRPVGSGTWNTRSQLVTAGDWLKLADQCVTGEAAYPEPGTAEQAREAGNLMALAVACVNEALAFVPPKGRKVPLRYQYLSGTLLEGISAERFQREHLEQTRDDYRRRHEAMSG